VQATLESNGKVRTFESGQTYERECWAGKIVSEPLKVTLKPLTNPDDLAAFKVLSTLEREGLGDGYRLMWTPSDKVYTGEDKRYVTVLEKYPKSVFAKDCELALAYEYARRFLYVRDGSGQPEIAGDFEQAVDRYSKVLKNYPTFFGTPRAKFGLAQLYLEKEKREPGKGFRDKALSFLEDVVKNHAESFEAVAAAKLLNSPQAGKEPDEKEKKVDKDREHTSTSGAEGTQTPASDLPWTPSMLFPPGAEETQAPAAAPPAPSSAPKSGG